MPVGPYKDFAACVAANQDKDDPEAYCGTLERESKSDRIAISRMAAIVKADDEQRLVYGVVYEPDVFDAHDDRMSGAEIQKAAHGFMTRYALALGETGTDHAREVARDRMTIVETYCAPVDFQLGTQLVKAGTWVLVAKVHDAQLWKDVKARRYTGWSFEGWGRRLPVAP